MLKISNVGFTYQNQDVFDRANLVLPGQGVVAIIGDNGSGKSTLLGLISGQLQPDDGSVMVDGEVGYLAQVDDVDGRSGGEATRKRLEELFARNYDVLLLDEPTNNLDGIGINWLVVQLKKFRGLALVVSHDRDFIDQIAEKVIEIKAGGLQEYAGNYSDYRLRQEQLRNEASQQYQKAEKVRTKLERRIMNAQAKSEAKSRRFDKLRDESRMAFETKRSNAKLVVGRVVNNATKQLERLSDVEKPENRKVYQAKLRTGLAKHGRLLRVDNVAKNYGDKVVLNGVSLEVYPGERLHVVGKNGAGKTTLLRLMLQEIQPDSGVVQMADGITLGYIAQDVYGLDLMKSFLEQTEVNTTEVFRAAATMDLGVNELNRPLGQLSRGQLTKMAFLKIMLVPVDLLILDEPTNHLDIRAKENIERALANYPGAMVFATHDKAFAKALGEVKRVEL